MSGGHGHESASPHSGDHGGGKGGGFLKDVAKAVSPVPNIEELLFGHHGIAEVASQAGADLEAGHKVVKGIGGAVLGGIADISEGGEAPKHH